MPKANRKLSYKKCGFCRKHRQKCLPEGRQWPGPPCIRCKKYGYACSASLTRSEELNAASTGDSTSHLSIAPNHGLSLDPPTETSVSGYGTTEISEATKDCIAKLSDLTLLEERMRICFRVSNCWEERFQSVRTEAKACLSRLHHLLRFRATEYSAAGRLDEAANIYRCLYRDAASSSWASHGLGESLQEDEVEQDVDLRDPTSDMMELLCNQYEISGDYNTALRLCEHAYLRKPEPNHPSGILAGRSQERLSNRYRGFIHRVQGMHREWELMADMSTLYNFARALKRSPQVWDGVLLMDWRSSLLSCTEGKYLADSMPVLAMYIATYYDLPDLLHALFPGQWLTQVYLRDTWCRTALHVASELGSHDVARYLIEIGADTDDTDAGEDTPLHLACAQKQMELISLLVDAGANVNARNVENSTPLHRLLMLPGEGKAKLLMKPIVHYLLVANANPEFLDNTNHNVLHYAAQHGGSDVVRLLTPNFFRPGEPQDQESLKGYTPLHCAISSGTVNVALHLIEQGHDVNTADYEGKTPLHLACCDLGGLHASEVAECLLGHGALIDKPDNALNTPLHCAGQWGKVDVVKTLLARGAAINLCNRDGQTPFMLANSEGRTRVCKVLNECAKYRGQVPC